MFFESVSIALAHPPYALLSKVKLVKGFFTAWTYPHYLTMYSSLPNALRLGS